MSELKFLENQVKRNRISRRDFLGRASALGLTIAAASSLYGKALKAADPVKGGHMVLGLVGGASSDSLDPATFASQVPYTFGKTWGDQLVETDPNSGAPVAALAESWDASDDAKKWSFKIRKGVTFHNGQEMTVDDVVATLQRHGDEASQSGALGLMGGITGIKGAGDTLEIELAEANADLPLLLSDYHLIIQPGGGKDNPAAGIGTGPYMVDYVEQGVRLTGKKNPNYWRDDGHVDSVEILIINDDTARMAALQSGQVHAVDRVPPKTADLMKGAGVNVVNVSGKGHYVFIMHCDKEPFMNADLRMALKLAMDREAMVQTVLQGYGTVGNDFPINAAYDLFPTDIEQRKYDPEQAAFHFKKSGHSGPIDLRTSDVAFPGAIDAAVLYQQQAAACGIEINVIQEPGDGYWSNVWNVQPFCTSYWGGRSTQDQMYSTAYLSTADWNDTKWFRPDFDALLAQARGELDRAKRGTMYHDLALMVRDDGGLICPMFNDFVDAIGPNVEGFVKDISGELSNGYVTRRAWLTA